MGRIRSFAAIAVVLACAGPALAHGGQYRGPGGRVPNDPTAPGTGGGTPTAGWEAWWSANAWRYVNLRERLRRRDRPSGETLDGGIGTAVPTPGSSPSADDAFDPRKFHEDETLPVVLAALSDEDSEVRSAAAVALGKMGFLRSLPDLRRALKDEVRDVRDGAVLAIGMLGDPFAADDLRPLLLDPRQDDRTRSFAAIGLGFLRGPEGIEPLLSFLDPATDATRVGGIGRSNHTEASALTGIGLSGHQPAAAGLRRDYASDRRYEPQVRAFAAVALARLGDREAIPLLLQGIEHPREPMRQAAAIALGPLGKPGDAAVVQALSRRVLEDKDPATRQLSLMSLARIGGEDARAVVRRTLSKGIRLDLPWAALACAIGGDREMIPALRKLFAEERHASEKCAYMLALGLLADQDSAPEFLRLGAGQGDSSIRTHALVALGLTGVASAAPEVRAFMGKENDTGVRMAAATCLGLLQDPEAVPLLERWVKEGENVYMRSSACRILGHIGAPRSGAVLAAIVKDRKDNSVVRMTATAALGSLADPRLVPLLAEVSMDGSIGSSVDPLVEIASIM